MLFLYLPTVTQMPKRTDLHKIMIIGSGPIVIGQACEFDYSGRGSKDDVDKVKWRS
jgi:hypothetical protein